MAEKKDGDFEHIDWSTIGGGMEMTFRLSPDILNQVEELAMKHNMTRDAVVLKMFATGLWIAISTESGSKLIVRLDNDNEVKINLFPADDDSGLV